MKVSGPYNRDTGAALRDAILAAWDGATPVPVDFGGDRVCFTGFFDEAFGCLPPDVQVDVTGLSSFDMDLLSRVVAGRRRLDN